MDNKPLVEFAETGTAPILSYHVPDPVSYFGSFIMELDFPKEYFRPAGVLPSSSGTVTLDDVRKAMLGGFLDRRIFPFDCTQSQYRTKNDV